MTLRLLQATLRLVAVSSLWIYTSVAAADLVVMKNGDRISGKIDSILSGRLIIATAYAGTIDLDLKAVEALETEESLTVQAGSRRLSGRVAPLQEARDEADAQAGVRVGDEVVAMAEITGASRNQLNLEHLGNSWTSRADLSLVISNGNSKTENLNTLLESVLKRDMVQHDVSLLLSNEEADGVATKEQTDLDYGYKRFLSEQWFVAGNGEYFQDDIKEIDHRITLGAGAGYQFWDTSVSSLSTEVGLSVVQEELAGESESNPAVRWAVDYQRSLMAKKLSLFHKQEILFIPDGDRREVLSSSSGARYALSDRIDTIARVDVRHETDPPEGNSKTDVTYTLGIGVKF